MIKEGERHFSSFIDMTRAVKFHSYRLFASSDRTVLSLFLLFYCTWHAINSLVHFSKSVINFNTVSRLNRHSVDVILFPQWGEKGRS